MKKSSRETEWKQKRYPTVGVDLGDRFSRYCALNRDGEVIEEGRWAPFWACVPGSASRATPIRNTTSARREIFICAVSWCKGRTMCWAGLDRIRRCAAGD